MGNSIGNFQADVGRADSTMGLIIAYIMAGIMILIAIILTISAFIYHKKIKVVKMILSNQKHAQRNVIMHYFGD